MADLAVVANSVQKYGDAQTVVLTAGVAIAAGQVVCFDSASNTAKLGNAKKLPPFTVIKGVALHNAQPNQPIVVQTAGGFNPGVTVSVGQVYILSGNNDGGIAPVGDYAAGWAPQVLAIAVTPTRLQLAIENPALALKVGVAGLDFSDSQNSGYIPLI